MALPLVLRTTIHRLREPKILKAVDDAEFAAGGLQPQECALLMDRCDPAVARDIIGLQWGALISSRPLEHATAGFIATPTPASAISVGDVFQVSPNRPTARVLYRRGERGNVLFATEACNSFCLMCSQPPRKIDDSWRTGLNLRLIELIDKTEPSLAITGGEPTLLADGLVEIVRACKDQLPTTAIQILSNGRSLGTGDLAFRVAAVAHPRLQWDVPLYADVAPIHDYVVQADNAFEETIAGLYRLAESGQSIEIRVVLHKATVPRLTSLAEFIYRNLSFVRHVALMGIEPIGFARANRHALWIDPIDYQLELRQAVTFLADRGMRVSIYNLPMCVLLRDLWPFARQSISDWKNIYLPPCERCAARTRCSGFFASTSEEWVSRGVAPLSDARGIPT